MIYKFDTSSELEQLKENFKDDFSFNSTYNDGGMARLGEYYNYKGYVVDIVEENGVTVIVTLSRNVESRFTLKWYSREKYKKGTKET